MDPTVQLIINIGAIATAVAALVGLPVAAVKLWPLIKRAVAIGTSAEKLPEMALDLRSVAMEQRSQGETLTKQNGVLATITVEVEKVKQQVKNDHDSNLREDLDTVRDDVRALHLKIDAHLGAQQRTTINVNPGGAP